MERCFSGGAAREAATNRETPRPKSNRSVRQAFERASRGRDHGGAGLCPAGQPRATVPTWGPLIEGIDCQSAEELGIEVGGFLGHDFSAECDVSNLLDPAGVHQENDVGTRIVRSEERGAGKESAS